MIGIGNAEPSASCRPPSDEGASVDRALRDHPSCEAGRGRQSPCAWRCCGRTQSCSGQRPSAGNGGSSARPSEGGLWPRRRLAGAPLAERDPAGGSPVRSRLLARSWRCFECSARFIRQSPPISATALLHGATTLSPRPPAPAGHGAPRASEALQRPHRRARLSTLGMTGPPRLRVSLAKRRAGGYHQLER